MKKPPMLPHMDGLGCPPDELEVRQLLGDVATILHEPYSSRNKPDDSRLNEATRIFIEARTAAVEFRCRRRLSPAPVDKQESSDAAMTKSLDERLKLLGEELTHGMWTSLQEVVALAVPWDINLLIKCMKINPTPEAWQLFLDTRRSAVEKLSLSTLDSLNRSLPPMIQDDIDAFCVIISGIGIASLFPSLDPCHDAIERIVALVDYVYGPLLHKVIDRRMREVVNDATGWLDKATLSMQLPFVSYFPPNWITKRAAIDANIFPRAFPLLLSIPRSSNYVESLPVKDVSKRSFKFTTTSPRALAMKDMDILIADPSHHGLWIQQTVDLSDMSAVSAPNLIIDRAFVLMSELETVQARCKNKLRVDFKACIGWSVLIQISKDETQSTWMVGTITAYRKEDNNVLATIAGSAKMQLENWLPIDANLRLAPSDPRCRIHAGQRLFALLDNINDCAPFSDFVRRAILRGIWSSITPVLRPIRFIFSRYVRSAIREVLQRDCNVDNSRYVGQFVSSTGQYSHPVRLQEHLTRARAESIAAVLYDVGDCLQWGVGSEIHLELVRLFIQVVDEEVDSFCQSILVSIEDTDTASLKTLIETASGLLLLVDTWQHHLRPRLGLEHPDPDPAMHWSYKTFDRIDGFLTSTAHTVLHYVYNEWRQECALSYFPHAIEQAWTADKPYFNDTRVTGGVQCFIFRVQMLVRRLVHGCTMPFGTPLIPQTISGLCWKIIAHSFDGFTALYRCLEPSRARLDQFKMDVLYVVCGLYQAQKCVAPLGDSTRPAHLVGGLMEWLQVLALLFAPCDIILEHVPSAKKKSATALSKEVVLANQMQNLDQYLFHTMDEKVLKPWQKHSILRGKDPKILLQLPLQWSVLLDSCDFTIPMYVSWLKKRGETCASSYPQLTDVQSRDRLQLEELIAKLNSTLA
ncbi:hypothetical protein LEN26_000069 [Aphanomyces euteiches]|nr:hypothetical protein AeMF1_015729 [Aphanomyces euteiches]KAH9164434.1 hypothetical protein LEN26_000069 [Aphanomyces euteiches]KAH9197270.1 hypothetical protein AeNC1_000752 [Aphanomyces euteiches]